jgi:hypothetical protein
VELLVAVGPQRRQVDADVTKSSEALEELAALRREAGGVGQDADGELAGEEIADTVLEQGVEGRFVVVVEEDDEPLAPGLDRLLETTRSKSSWLMTSRSRGSIETGRTGNGGCRRCRSRGRGRAGAFAGTPLCDVVDEEPLARRCVRTTGSTAPAAVRPGSARARGRPDRRPGSTLP